MDYAENDLRVIEASRQIQSQSVVVKRTLAMRSMEFVRSIGSILRDGISFRGNRDVYTVYGYKSQITYFDCLAKYHRQDIAKRIVDMPADAIWSYPPEIQGAAKVVATFKDLEDRLSLWQQLNRADRIAGMDKYSAILIGIDDGKPLDQPVDPSRKNTIIFIQPYAGQTLKITEFEANYRNPRFGKPLYYSLQPTTTNTAVSLGGMGNIFGMLTDVVSRIHYSRVVHVLEGPLEDDIFGTPRLMNCFNLLEDLLKVGGGSSEIYWLNARGGLHIDIDKDIQLPPGGDDEVADEVHDYTNNFQRVIRTRGVKIAPIKMDVHDPRGTFSVTVNLLAGAQGIPQRILFGSEAGQLASEQDRANWAVYVKQRRQNFAEPRVMRPFITTLIGLGFFSLADALQTQVLWPEAFQLSPLERAQTSAQQARSAANLFKVVQETPAVPATPATPATKTSPASPGTPAQPEVKPLLSIDEAREIVFMGYNAPVNRTAPEDPNALS